MPCDKDIIIFYNSTIVKIIALALCWHYVSAEYVDATNLFRLFSPYYF